VNAPGAKPLTITDGGLTFQDVSFSYGESSALKGIRCVVPAGKITALVGRSGAGKSTLLSLIPRLYDPTSGTIAIDGQDITHVTLDSLRTHIAVVSQDITLFDDTIRANLTFNRSDISEDALIEATKAAAAHEFIQNLPQGYETQVGERGTRLSGGERQRIALARALLKNAPILHLDEATSALDMESERLIAGAMNRLMEGRTTLVIAHRLSTVRHADVIIVLDKGQIVETGDHTSLMAQDGLYKHLYQLQFH
jgi:subfamily B ATP-binding cassette protein MsbA